MTPEETTLLSQILDSYFLKARTALDIDMTIKGSFAIFSHPQNQRRARFHIIGSHLLGECYEPNSGVYGDKPASAPIDIEIDLARPDESIEKDVVQQIINWLIS